MVKELDAGVFVTFWIYIVICCATEIAALSNSSSPMNGDVEVQRIGQDLGKSNNTLSCVQPISYVCEEPWNVLPFKTKNEKFCNFRNSEYPEQIYLWEAGWSCLGFTHNHLFVAGYNNINMRSRCHYGNTMVPCLEIVTENGVCACFPFDPAFEKVADIINAAMIPTAQGRWERCYNEAEECCRESMGQNNTQIGTSQCPATFDGWTCWQSAEADTVASEVCTEFAYSGSGPTCHHYSTKMCYSNNIWEIQTDYSSCSITSRLLSRYRYHIAMLAFSIATCLPAVFVFFFYKRLRVPRVALHRNLLIAIILRNIAVIISRTEVYIDVLTNSTDSAMNNHSIACRALAIFERGAANAVFVCMLIEGVYLHRMIVAVFKKKLNTNVLYAVGAVIVIAPVVTWSIVMGALNDHSCWVVYTVSQIQWILDAPRIAILVINTVLFVDILRVLLTTKMRNPESTNQLNTTKATLFLMPLFGSQFLLTAIRPSTTNCTYEQVYYFITYTVEGLQGFIVAMLYCYVNKEVHNLIKATYMKTESAVVSRIRKNSIYPRSEFESSSRRMTYSTYYEEEPQIRTAEIITLDPEESYAEIIEAVHSVQACYTNGDKGYLVEAETDSGIVPNEDLAKDTSHSNSASPDAYNDNPETTSCQNQPAYEPVSYDEVSYESQPQTHEYELFAYDNDAYDAMGEYDSEPNTNAHETNKHETQLDDNYESPLEHILDKSRSGNLLSDNHEYTEALSDIEDTKLYDTLMHLGPLNSTHNTDEDVMLDPNVLSPNRKAEDKIIFL